MSVSDLPIFSILKSRMQWHQSRQKVLAENVANADTPGFKTSDLAPFQRVMDSQGAVGLVKTDPGHMDMSGGGSRQFGDARDMQFEVRPTGNAVNLEDEMMKVADNQMDFQMVSALYSRSLGLLKTAIGKR